MRALLLAVALTSLLPAQDVLHYRFESGGGDTVVNLAGDSGIAPELAHLVGMAPGNPFADGRFGGGYAPPTDTATEDYRLDTGWDGAFAGDFTLSFWLRERRSEQASSTIFDSYDGLRFHVDPQGPAQFRLNRNVSLVSQGDLALRSRQGWTHIVITGRETANANYVWLYVDGALDTRLQLPPTQSLRAPHGAEYGLHLGGSGITTPSGAGLESAHDIDEFLFRHGASTVADVQALMRGPLAADSRYGAGCNGIGDRGGFLTRAATDQLPTLGNTNYGWRLQGFPGSLYSILVGSHRASFQGQPLPFDLAAIDPSFAGCLLDTAADVTTLTGTLDVAGNDTIPVPVPADPSFEGLSLFAQAALLHIPSTTFMLSNGFAVSIGR